MFQDLGVINVWAYALGALVIVLIPGPNSLFVLKTSIKSGTKAASAAACAVFLGDATLMFASYLGMAALIAAHPGIFTAIRIGGGLYLAYLGIQAIRSAFFPKKAAPGAAAPKAADSGKAFRTALVLSLTNPKAILFYIAFFVQFIDPSYPHPGVPYLIEAVIFETFSMIWLFTLIRLGRAMLTFAGNRPALTKAGSTALGSLFILFAGKFALDF
ncbi:MAG: Leucine efflux protein LeuE [Burkholderia sp.]|jgi:leucine efflux protein